MTLRMEDIIHAMEMVKRPDFNTVLLPPVGVKSIKEHFDDQLPMRFMGMRVIESPYARMPAKAHKRRRGMSEAYHRRIQKKWNKRFGYVPAAFFIDAGKILGAIRFSPSDIGESSDG